MLLNRRAMLGCSAATLASWPALLRSQGPPSGDSVASGRRGVVATVHPLATEAGLRTMQQGGNAVDAAVAAALMLAVVDGHNSGLGGGCFILARGADGKTIAIDGRETAPAAAHPKMFIRDGRPDPSLSQTGPLAVGVPGAVAAYHQLSRRGGTGRWSSAASAAAERAAEGFEIGSAYAARLASVADSLGQFEASRALFLRPDGTPLQAGDLLVQNDLAATLGELAADGPDAFYRGRFAEQTARWMSENGGLITAEDLRRYFTRQRTPVETAFGDYQILGFPPPSSGGVHVAQILGMLERFDLASMYRNDPTSYYHVIGEAMRLAFADRAEWLGDPTFTDVPRGLIDPEYLKKRSAMIRLDHRIPIVNAGGPPGLGKDLFGRLPRHTTHLTAADDSGNWVAITTTVNTTFGSKIVVPGTGVVLNNQMDDFSIAPGLPNAFGLVGNEANAPEPGKRPLSSMSPTIVLREGHPVLSCGAAGGPRIISAVAQILLRVLSLEESLSAAIAAPRIHHQWRPDLLYVEDALDPQIVAALEQLGHRIRSTGGIATAQAIGRSDDGRLIAVAEPRLPGTAGSLEE